VRPILAWLASLAAGLAPVTAQELAIVGQAEVVDGDGLSIGPLAIRLHGIDAAELGQRCKTAKGGTWPCDEAAASRLASLIGDEPVRCEPLDRDAYGRIIARCFAEDVDLSRTLAVEGLAWAFVRYSSDYVQEEATARSERLGVWQAESEPPWEYRADRWERAAAESPQPGCPIKGNINAEGERIYHTPWSPWYRRTKIDEAKEERWFCDEAEALEAGWRAARFR